MEVLPEKEKQNTGHNNKMQGFRINHWHLSATNVFRENFGMYDA